MVKQNEKITLQKTIHDHIYNILIKNNWNRTATAKDLMVSVRTVHNYVKKLRFFGYYVGNNEDNEPIEIRRLKHGK